MRGQSGVGTIIIFIAAILVGVIAAIVFLQVTNALKSQAVLTHRQAEETMSARYQIDKVEGIALKDPDGVYRLHYIVLRVKVGIGAETLSWDKTLLTYSDGEATIPGAKYKPVYETILENNAYIATETNKDVNTVVSWAYTLTDACNAEMYDIMTFLGSYSYADIVRLVAPTKGGDPANPDFSRYTVVWEDCDNKNDVYSLYDGQTAYVIYPLPRGLDSREYFTVDLHVSEGWTNPMRLRVPAGLDRKYVVIYPAT